MRLPWFALAAAELSEPKGLGSQQLWATPAVFQEPLRGDWQVIWQFQRRFEGFESRRGLPS